MFLEVFMLIKKSTQSVQRSILFVFIGIFWTLGLGFNLLCLMTAIKNIVILNIHGVGYHCIILKISKSEVMNLLKNADLTGKSGLL